MLVQGDYEILPTEELDYLRKEVERLKQNPFGETKQGKTMMEAITVLNDNVSQLVQIFRSANAEMVKAYHENSYQQQLQTLRGENAKIARGIVALADLIKEIEDKQPKKLAPIDDFLQHHETQDDSQDFTADPQLPTQPSPQDLQFDEHNLTQELKGGPDQQPPAQPPQQPNPFLQEQQRPLTGKPAPQSDSKGLEPDAPPPPPAPQ
ncbi:hypothetical protein GOV11_00380 [Candidatus Woesearchaeota archaeon]|nr:hypothetical protein [Candidatus Woesearchaeota archaeon]